jgi:hypothetical protein
VGSGTAGLTVVVCAGRVGVTARGRESGTPRSIGIDDARTVVLANSNTTFTATVRPAGH